jgi:hypothetical protein
MIDDDKKGVDIPNSAFYANSFVIQMGGRDVFIDFQGFSPRFEIGNPSKTYAVSEHSTTLLNVALFKDFIKTGAELIKTMEEKFGEVTSPEFVKRLSKSNRKYWQK